VAVNLFNRTRGSHAHFKEELVNGRIHPQHGVISQLFHPESGRTYIIIAGERRWRLLKRRYGLSLHHAAGEYSGIT
jgi:hypothetical protein